MQYIPEHRNILQCSTIGLSTQSKYVSTIDDKGKGDDI